MGDRRKTRGPPIGWQKLPKPAPGQPGTLRPDILVDRRRFFSLVPHGPLTSVVCVSSDHHGARHRRAFLTTRSGFDTMTRRRQDATDDKITEADDTAGDATFGGAPHQWPKAGHTSFYA